ncbi:MAG: HEAT repeat domain-containing protein, partial [Proteobacteria bacterium]|nr:HEAT repeat domain-containing protein [Pseudomonadota bacterium]
AIIGLGNFRDERAVSVLARILAGGGDELRGYAAWALGMIGGNAAKKHLASALGREKHGNVIAELRRALQAG